MAVSGNQINQLGDRETTGQWPLQTVDGELAGFIAGEQPLPPLILSDDDYQTAQTRIGTLYPDDTCAKFIRVYCDNYTAAIADVEQTLPHHDAMRIRSVLVQEYTRAFKNLPADDWASRGLLASKLFLVTGLAPIRDPKAYGTAVKQLNKLELSRYPVNSSLFDQFKLALLGATTTAYNLQTTTIDMEGIIDDVPEAVKLTSKSLEFNQRPPRLQFDWPKSLLESRAAAQHQDQAVAQSKPPRRPLPKTILPLFENTQELDAFNKQANDYRQATGKEPNHVVLLSDKEIIINQVLTRPSAGEARALALLIKNYRKGAVTWVMIDQVAQDLGTNSIEWGMKRRELERAFNQVMEWGLAAYSERLGGFIAKPLTIDEQRKLYGD